MRKLEDICAAVERTEVPGYPQIHLTLSIGGVYEKGQLKNVLEKADEALYEAKRQRGACRYPHMTGQNRRQSKLF